MTDQEQLTPEEIELLEGAMKSYGAPQPDEKHNVHTFLHKVSLAVDTTKTGNLTEIEIGYTPYSLRTYKQLSLVCSDIVNDDIWGEYYRKKGEILTATSLSKEGFLMKQATTQTRQIADVTKKYKQNKGWFTKKDKSEEGEK